MSIQEVFFFAFASVLVGSALAVITVRNMVHAALFLVLCFFSSACIWILLEAEFLAVTLVLVYVGAVMVLFLFVVMMLDVRQAPLREGFARYLPVAALVAVVMAAQMFAILASQELGLDRFAFGDPKPAEFSNTAWLGRSLYTEFVLPFEIAAVILTVAIIAAIMLTLRDRPDSLHQVVSEQVQVRKEDRLRVVKMASEVEHKQ